MAAFLPTASGESMSALLCLLFLALRSCQLLGAQFPSTVKCSSIEKILSGCWLFSSFTDKDVYRLIGSIRKSLLTAIAPK